MTLKTKTGMFNYLSSYFSDNTGDESALLEFLKDCVDSYEDSLVDVVYIKRRGDLPEAEDGVISLNSNKSYILTTDLDLQGERIVLSSKAKVAGFSSETCNLSSTGLAAGESIVSTGNIIDIENITFSPSAGTKALNVANVSGGLFMNNCYVKGDGDFGSFSDIEFIIINNVAFENSGTGAVFDGNIETIGYTDCLFENSVEAIKALPTLTLTRRLRIRDSYFRVSQGSVGINFDPASSIPVEGYNLKSVNFSGEGTYLQGYNYQHDVTRFSECRGITNTSRLGQMILSGNTLTTTVSEVDTYYKVAGASIAGGINQRFTHQTPDRLTYESELVQNFLISATASLNAGSNEEASTAIFKNGSLVVGSEVSGTTGSGGRAEGLASQGLVTLERDDYVELFVKNVSSSSDITVTEFNFIIREI